MLGNTNAIVITKKEFDALAEAIRTETPQIPNSTDAAVIDRTVSSYNRNSLTKVGPYAFYSCVSLWDNANVYALNNCSEIGEYAFYHCSSSRFSLCSFNSCITVGDYAFGYCYSLSMVSLPACTYIGEFAFYMCSSLISGSRISLPACTEIGYGAFQACYSLMSITLPACEVIGSSAFGYCYSLSMVSLPACTYIGACAFDMCQSLTRVYLLGSSVATLGNTNAFRSSPMSTSSYTGGYGSIYVPSSLYNDYRETSSWSAYRGRFVSR